MEERKTEDGTDRKMVTLLLTRHYDPFSNYICRISRSPYSHASISIDPEQKKFYSFNKKGFVEEYPGNWKRKNTSMSICIFVTGEVYARLKNEIDHFLEKKKSLHYSLLGVFFCILHIPVHFKNSYFCSQFVAELLEDSGTAILKKKSELYLPDHLISQLEYRFLSVRCIYGAV